MKVIELTQGYVAVVDDEDYKRVKKHSWHVHFSRGSKRKAGEPYARARIDGQDVYLHRYLMKNEIEFCHQVTFIPRQQWHVDHKNNQTLDCRQSNLNVCLHAENSKNKKKAKRKRKFIVDIETCDIIGFDFGKKPDHSSIVIGELSENGQLKVKEIKTWQQ